MGRRTLKDFMKLANVKHLPAFKSRATLTRPVLNGKRYNLLVTIHFMVSPAFLEAHPHFAAMDAKQEPEEPEEPVEPTVRPVGRGAAKAAALEAKAAVMSRRPVVTMLPPALAASGSPPSSVPAMSSAADSSAHLAALAAAAAASTSSLLPAAAPAAVEDALSQRLTRLEGSFAKIERFIEGKLAAPVVSAQSDVDSFDQSVQQPQPRLSVRPDARWRSSASGPPSASSDAAYIVESLSSVFEGALARMERMVFFCFSCLLCMHFGNFLGCGRKWQKIIPQTIPLLRLLRLSRLLLHLLRARFFPHLSYIFRI